MTMMRRNRFDVRGHSGREPVFVVKQSQNTDGLPLKVALNQRAGLQVWSPRDREYITGERAARLELQFQIHIDTAMRFVAKVALSAGYFVYGDLFRDRVKHSDFSVIMNSQLPNREGLEGVEAGLPRDPAGLPLARLPYHLDEDFSGLCRIPYFS